ncbi:serine/threonine protein phosphatase [Aureimonas sp. SA4125]|uniref:metallophosphoesterase n=1 Tax=Aureimonas sp. SA4125 TaxID=2826993 RepID=UPI001CC3760A|nr:metallophosphoesterase [Aureimonas sp. SA4125]BDA83356.1 serine/threonine protein phosphatase [Aureimonas sp. SA4125]
MGLQVLARLVQSFASRWTSGTGQATKGAAHPPRRRLQLPVDPSVTYAVGDVHGCIDHLRALEEVLIEDARDRAGVKLIIMLGDYVDRGPNSAAVIEHLLAEPPPGFFRVCLSGNHEEVMLDTVRGRSSLDRWLDFGGEATLLSYGLDVRYMREEIGLDNVRILDEMRRSIPARHISFLESLASSLATPSFLFAHAGARPGVALSDQVDHDLMWIRSDFLDSTAIGFDKTVVHGHSITAEPFLSPLRIGVDTGAYLGGGLTASRLADGQVNFLRSY